MVCFVSLFLYLCVCAYGPHGLLCLLVPVFVCVCVCAYGPHGLLCLLVPVFVCVCECGGLYLKEVVFEAGLHSKEVCI